MKMTQAEFFDYASQLNEEKYDAEKSRKIAKILTKNFGFRYIYGEKSRFAVYHGTYESFHFEGTYIKVNYETQQAIKVFVYNNNGKGGFSFKFENYDTTNKFQTNKEAIEAMKEIEKLESSYDHHTQYIENYKQMKQAEQSNEDIEKRIAELTSKL